MTKIEWTEHSWNPVQGCSHESPGCANCYAEAMARRFSWGAPYVDRDGRWNGRVELNWSKIEDPLRWRKPRTVFVNSASDLFHEALFYQDIQMVFAYMAAAHTSTFQILTKRAGRMKDFVTKVGELPDPAYSCIEVVSALAEKYGLRRPHYDKRYASWPLQNVWLGVSVENQRAADERIPLLVSTPAFLRFVSVEPLLGPISLDPRWLGQGSQCQECGDSVAVDEDGCCSMCGRDAMWYGVDWVIVGGESGPKARPCQIEWLRDIVRQCHEASVPCFVKQLGSEPIDRTLGQVWLRSYKGNDPSEWPEDLRVREFPERRLP